MAAPKGHTKAGGRAMGTPNKVSAFIKSSISNALNGYFEPSPETCGRSQFELDLDDLDTPRPR